MSLTYHAQLLRWSWQAWTREDIRAVGQVDSNRAVDRKLAPPELVWTEHAGAHRACLCARSCVWSRDAADQTTDGLERVSAALEAHDVLDELPQRPLVLGDYVSQALEPGLLLCVLGAIDARLHCSLKAGREVVVTLGQERDAETQGFLAIQAPWPAPDEGWRDVTVSQVRTARAKTWVSSTSY
jgi:hypothetical protein